MPAAVRVSSVSGGCASTTSLRQAKFAVRFRDQAHGRECHTGCGQCLQHLRRLRVHDQPAPN